MGGMRCEIDIMTDSADQSQAEARGYGAGKVAAKLIWNRPQRLAKIYLYMYIGKFL